MPVIGVISDTHGLMREEALRALEGENVEMILHAGDLGNIGVLEQLHAIAPVTAIRGNVDQGLWAQPIPETTMLGIDGITVYMLHDLNQLDIDPAAAGVGIIISGHSHVPVIEHRNGVLYLNPGSAGPKRFTLPVSLAILHIKDGSASAKLIDLEKEG